MTGFLPQPSITFLLTSLLQIGTRIWFNELSWVLMSSHFIGKCHTLIYINSCEYIELSGHSFPKLRANSFPVVCAVFALDSWKYCSGEQLPDSLISSSQCLPIWLHWVRGCGIPCYVPPCGKVIYMRWQHLIFKCIYIFQLYKVDCTILRICWAVGPCSTGQ